jgi:hypothetical protein
MVSTRMKEYSRERKGHEPHEYYGEPEVRYARKSSAAICYGASMYRPGKTPSHHDSQCTRLGDYAL